MRTLQGDGRRFGSRISRRSPPAISSSSCCSPSGSRPTMASVSASLARCRRPLGSTAPALPCRLARSACWSADATASGHRKLVDLQATGWARRQAHRCRPVDQGARSALPGLAEGTAVTVASADDRCAWSSASSNSGCRKPTNRCAGAWGDGGGFFGVLSPRRLLISHGDRDGLGERALKASREVGQPRRVGAFAPQTQDL